MSSELRQIWELTRGQRWFSGHSRDPEPVELTLLPPIAPDPGAPRSALLDIAYPDGAQERYHLPLIRSGGGWADACADAAAMRAVAAALEGQQPGFTRFSPLPDLGNPRRYDGEQSNTSVFFGPMLLKVFRRLEPGLNLDVEIHKALAGTGLVAEIHGVWQDGNTDLGIFLEAFHDPLDGFVAARDAARSGTGFTEHARALGASLAAVHAGLGRALKTGTASRTDLSNAIRARFETAAVEVPSLLPARPALERILEELGEGDYATQRVHGDCHLGQVLLTDGMWRWVDFEGEPLKTLEERRAPDSPLRDLAGMLRSFAYAAAGSPDPQWESACRDAFLEGYGVTGIETALLRAYEVDKAVYEVIYEARNRPTWLPIPLRALGL